MGNTKPKQGKLLAVLSSASLDSLRQNALLCRPPLPWYVADCRLLARICASAGIAAGKSEGKPCSQICADHDGNLLGVLGTFWGRESLDGLLAAVQGNVTVTAADIKSPLAKEVVRCTTAV